MQAYDALSYIYDEWMAHYDYDRWANYLCTLLQKYHVLPGARLLELACGTGQITRRLCRSGYRMIASDCSQPMLEQAQLAMAGMQRTCQLIEMDMRDIHINGQVQAVVCTCDGFNYLTDDTMLSACLQGIRNILAPGGVLLFDISSSAKLLAMDGQLYAEEDDAAAYIWQNTYDADTGCLNMDISLYIQEEEDLFRRFIEQHVQRVYDTAALTDALLRHGFTEVCVYDAFTQAPPRADSQRIQFCAVMPK